MIFFELANEPGIPPAEWNQLQAKLLATVRQAAPGNTILLTGSPTSTAWSLADLAPVADSDVAYTFHLYQPMAFTHQGADWDARFQPLRGIHYPPDAERTGGQAGLPAAAAQELANYRRHGATLMGDDVAAAARWAGDHHAHLVVTEFGVYRTADLRSRAAWMSEARRRLEQSGIGWTVWEYDGGFGIKPDLEHCTTVAAALGLRCIREAPAG
jgi:endoglucanase